MESEFLCTVCNVDVLKIQEFNFMLTMRTWNEALCRTVTCIGCIEKRLGRQLIPDDFSQAELNRLPPQSARLQDRLAGKVFLSDERLPAARALRHFVKEMGISIVAQPCSHQHPQAETHAHLEITRDGRVVVLFLDDVSASSPSTLRSRAGDILERLDRIARRYCHFEGWESRRLIRWARRRSGLAEAAMRQLLSFAERERLRRICRLPGSDNVLPRNVWASPEQRFMMSLVQTINPESAAA